ncbi:hypothetical protein [Streptomyces cellulosae]|uniref:hypothetical protein n=1 Tax=Streptomyces cellulosae TaxID=1968 RepID=UPI000ADEA43D|nr:hypothetical protein [Streptomyces cellulosae]
MELRHGWVTHAQVVSSGSADGTGGASAAIEEHMGRGVDWAAKKPVHAGSAPSSLFLLTSLLSPGHRIPQPA